MIFEDLGEQLVRNIAHPVRAFRLRLGETGPEAAAPEAVDETVEPPAAPPVITELSGESEVALELAFWESVKDGTPAELETYLEQYPEGTFAALARTRREAALQPEAGTAQAAAEPAADPLDLAFWESVKDSNRREEIEAYLEQHPNGHFAGLARARLSSPEMT